MDGKRSYPPVDRAGYGVGGACSAAEKPAAKAVCVRRRFQGPQRPLLPPVLEAEAVRASFVSHPCDKKRRMDGAPGLGAEGSDRPLVCRGKET